MSVRWSDLGDTAAHAISNVVAMAPFPGVATQYVWTQDYMQPKANFSPLALNTAHPDDATYRLTEERNFKDMGGGIQTWTREYCKVPTQYFESSSYAYSFIGYLGPLPTPGVPTPADLATYIGRLRQSFTVPAKLQNDFYLVDGVTYTVPADIPVVQATKYIGADGSTLVDYLYSSPPYSASSTPSRSTYEGYIAADAGTASSFSLTAEASRLERWKGNIWKRSTLYIKAV